MTDFKPVLENLEKLTRQEERNRIKGIIEEMIKSNKHKSTTID